VKSEGVAPQVDMSGRIWSDEEVLSSIIFNMGCGTFKKVLLAEPRLYKLFEPALKHLKRKNNHPLS
jgi:hypothetical protein